jgi:hypothetical protein
MHAFFNGGQVLEADRVKLKAAFNKCDSWLAVNIDVDFLDIHVHTRVDLLPEYFPYFAYQINGDIPPNFPQFGAFVFDWAQSNRSD